MTIYEKLATIQRELKAPKGQHNKFGGYNYRSCEDILEAVKPHLDGLVLTLDDEIADVGGRIYVVALACLTDGENRVVARGWAREPESRKGMDDSQITGAASSYARKYALNGLFCIDDTKDADSTNKHGKAKEDAPDVPAILDSIKTAANEQALKGHFAAAWQMLDGENQRKAKAAYDTRKAELEAA